jgi:hypothetical protein
LRKNVWPRLLLLAIAALALGCRLDQTDPPADVTFISIGESAGRHLSIDGLQPNHPREEIAHVVAAGQPMPSGGTFERLARGTAIACNELGQLAFVAVIAEGGNRRRAAYRQDTDGRLSFLLKEGMPTERGTVRRLAPADLGGIGLNNQGQVALPIEMDDGSPLVMLLGASVS